MLKERWQTLTTETGANRAAQLEDERPTAALINTLGPLCFEGPDVLSFLQGYLTIDLEQLADGKPRLAALTSLKGRVVATGWCQARGDERVDWLIHANLIAPVSEFMARYLAFSKTTLIGTEQDWLTVGVTDRQGQPSARLICSEAELDELAASHRLSAAADWFSACIEQKMVLIGPETTEAYLPQMIGLVEAGAVDFDKGCYLGQEVVARAQHRGEVKRRLIGLTGAKDRIPPGTPLANAEGKEQGNVLMSEPPLCLGVVRHPAESSYRAMEAQLTAIQP